MPCYKGKHFQTKVRLSATGGALTPWIDNESAVSAANCEALALDTEASDLALLQYVFEPGEMLNLPDKFPLKVFAGVHTLGLYCPSFQAHSVKAAAEGAGFLDDMKGCCESCCVILHVTCVSVPAATCADWLVAAQHVFHKLWELSFCQVMLWQLRLLHLDDT